jgi:hypothetical protein
VRFFLVMVVHLTNPHVLLGATSERGISTLGRDGGSCHGAHLLFSLALLHSQYDFSARSGPRKGLDRVSFAGMDVVFALRY